VAEAHSKAISAHVVPEPARREDVDRDEQELEEKIETAVQRMEAGVWMAAIAVRGGEPAIGRLLIRFLR
jgi:hypothetical protein